MPIARIQIGDRTARLEVPEGTTEAQVLAFAQTLQPEAQPENPFAAEMAAIEQARAETGLPMQQPTAEEIAQAPITQAREQRRAEVAERMGQVAEGVSKLPEDALRLGTDLVKAFTVNLPETASGLKSLVWGTVNKLVPGEIKDERVVDALLDDYRERYGSEAGIFKAISERPAEFISDLTLVAGVPLRTAGVAARTTGMKGLADDLAETAQTVERMDPVVMAASPMMRDRAPVQEVPTEARTTRVDDVTDAPIDDAVEAVDLTPDLTPKIVRQAQKGKESAKKQVAEAAAPDPVVISAAKELGVDELLKPDHVSTNQAFIELQQAAKSEPGSTLRRAEIEGLEETGRVFKGELEKIGGTDDLSTLNDSIRTKLESNISKIQAKESKFFDELRAEIPATTIGKTDNLKEYFDRRIAEVEEFDNLNPTEKSVYSKLIAGRGGDVVDDSVKYGDDVRNIGIDQSWLINALRKNNNEAFVLYDSIIKNGYEKGWDEASKTIDTSKITQKMEDDILKLVDYSKPRENFEMPNSVIESVINLTGEKPPLTKSFSDIIKSQNKDIDLRFIEKDGVIELSKIEVPEDLRGSGLAKKALADIAQLADEKGKRISLSPSDDFGANKSKLTKLYKEFGFVENKGSNKDYSISDAMYRNPSKKDQVVKGDPKYTLIDDVRKELGVKMNQSQAFTDENLGRVKELYSLISEDLGSVADDLGLSKKRQLANSLTKARKGFENDMVILFGNQLDKSLIQPLKTAGKKLSEGDYDKLRNMLNSVPKSMRKDVAASALMTAMGKATKNGEFNFGYFANWYQGLEKNKKAYNFLMSNLPQGSAKNLENIYKVSKSINRAIGERIYTGRINVLEFKKLESLMEQLTDIGKKSMIGAPLEVLTSSLGLFGAGISSAITGSIMQALGGKRSTALQDLAELSSDPKFVQLMREQAKKGAVEADTFRKASNSKAFNKIMNKMKVPKETRLQWLEQALRAPEKTQEEEE